MISKRVWFALGMSVVAVGAIAGISIAETVRDATLSTVLPRYLPEAPGSGPHVLVAGDVAEAHGYPVCIWMHAQQGPDPAADLWEKIPRLELEVVLVDVGHGAGL